MPLCFPPYAAVSVSSYATTRPLDWISKHYSLFRRRSVWMSVANGLVLLGTQRFYRVNRGGTARGNVACEQCSEDKNRDNDR